MYNQRVSDRDAAGVFGKWLLPKGRNGFPGVSGAGMVKRRLDIMVKAVVGANWGDEGKGKITDMLAEKADIIIRFQGGANAGHTIVNDFGKFALHTLPSGVFYSHTTSIIGNGVALNIPLLFQEIQSVTDRNVPMPKLLVSDRRRL